MLAKPFEVALRLHEIQEHHPSSYQLMVSIRTSTLPLVPSHLSPQSQLALLLLKLRSGMNLITSH